jgi:hypothetical protein
MELCTPTWLNHDYGDKGVVDILVVDAYFRMELCTPTWLKYNYGDGGLWIYWWWTHIPKWSYARQYFWVRLAKKICSKSFKKIQNSNGHIP